MCREASEGYYGSVITKQPDSVAILVIYAAVLVYTTGTLFLQASGQQNSLTGDSFTAATEGTLHWRDRIHCCLFCLISQIMPSSS